MPNQLSLSSPNFFHKSRVADNDIIVADELELDGTFIGRGTTQIYAIEIRISSNLVLTGSKLLLHARKISSDGGVIDVSGAKGLDALQVAAESGAFDGAAGSNGANGDKGQNGGVILVFAGEVLGNLTLIADGGKGGRGQPGGNGAKGADGAPGPDGHCTRGQDEKGGSGGNGAPGGGAGAGGTGGDGGDGGTVRIWAITMSAAISIRTNGGTGGDGGDHGQPGSGGNGGQGGRDSGWFEGGGRGPYSTINAPQAKQAIIKAYSQQPHRAAKPRLLKKDVGLRYSAEIMMLIAPHCIKYDSRGPQGAPGPLGPAVSTPRQNGKSGTTADSTLWIQQCTMAILAATSYEFQLQAQLHRRENDYLTGQFDRASAGFFWLAQLTDPTAAIAAIPIEVNDFTAIDHPTPVSLRSTWARSNLLLNQLKAGVDYYGSPPQYVPRVDFEVYDQVADELLQIAKAVEDQSEVYEQEALGQQARIDALKMAISSAKQVVDTVGDEIKVTEQRARAANAAITSLLVACDAEQQELLKAANTFKQDIETQSGCSFLDVIGFIGALIIGTQAAIAGLQAVLKDVRQLAVAPTGKDIIEDIKLISKDVAGIRTEFGKIKASIAARPDSAKLAVTEADFEETIKPYLRMPSAVAYRDSFRRFVGFTKDRNAKLLEYTTLMIKLESLTQKRDQAVRDIRDLEDRIKRVFDPSILPAVLFMARQNAFVKALAVEALYQQHRAYMYRALDPGSSFPYSGDMKVAQILPTSATIKMKALRAENARGSNKQGVTDTFTLTQNDCPVEWETFMRTGVLHFTIDPFGSFLQGMNRDVTVREANVFLPGIETDDGWLLLTLMHTGNPQFIRWDGEVVRFMHTPRLCTLNYNYQTHDIRADPTDNLGGKAGKFIDLSPFGAWILSVSPLNRNARLGGITAVSIQFKGTFLMQP